MAFYGTKYTSDLCPSNRRVITLSVNNIRYIQEQVKAQLIQTIGRPMLVSDEVVVGLLQSLLADQRYTAEQITGTAINMIVRQIRQESEAVAWDHTLDKRTVYNGDCLNKTNTVRTKCPLRTYQVRY